MIWPWQKKQEPEYGVYHISVIEWLIRYYNRRMEHVCSEESTRPPYRGTVVREDEECE